MSAFEYLIALVSVVVGLAIAQTLGGLLKVIHHRESARAHWLPLLWTASLILWTIFFWWFTFNRSEFTEVRILQLVFVLGYAGALYFVLGLLYPSDLSAGFDMRAHFEANRRWFYGALLVLGVFDVIDTTWAMTTGLNIPPPAYVALLGNWVVGSSIGLWVTDRRYHYAYAIVFAVLLVYHFGTIAPLFANPG